MNLPSGFFLQGKKYRLTNTVGQGGFGITYQGVWNTEVKGGLGAMKTTVPVCIKEYFFKDYCYRDNSTFAVNVHSMTGEKLFGKFKEKLIEEANILSAVHHPNIVSVLEVFEENNTAYIVMEYIKGNTLKYILDNEGILPEHKVIKYTHQIGNALNFVHEKNIVHLDIKPGNILIDQNDQARLIDFGVSKRFDIGERDTNTTTLTISKGFAPIEQYDDEGMTTFSPAPDIYSLGATMYNLLTGVVPVESILRATKQMLPPSAYNSNISPKTEKAILKAMEIKPENRFRKVNEMLAVIDAPTYEFTENVLTETNRIEDEDSTEVLHGKVFNHPKKNNIEVEDEEDLTIFNTPAISGSKRKSRHQGRRRAVLTFVIILCAFIGYAVFSYFFDITGSQGVSMQGGYLPLNTNLAFINQVDSVEPDSTGQLETDTLTTGQDAPNIQPETKNNQGTSPRNVEPPAITPKFTPTQIASAEKNIKDLWSSGKNKMESSDFEGALNDFKKGQEVANSYEITISYNDSRLIFECEEKIKEQKAKEYRKNTYNVFSDTGYITVVSKKTTNKFGAINNLNEEIIPCKYTTRNRIWDIEGVEYLEFMREDGLVDIYDRKGDLIEKGVPPSK